MFLRDYIPIMYIFAQLYVTTCDLYSCHSLWKAITVSDEAIIWQLFETQQRDYPIWHLSVKRWHQLTTWKEMFVVYIMLYYNWHVPLIQHLVRNKREINCVLLYAYILIVSVKYATATSRNESTDACLSGHYAWPLPYHWYTKNKTYMSRMIKLYQTHLGPSYFTQTLI